MLLSLELDGEVYEAGLDRRHPTLRVRLNGRVHEVVDRGTRDGVRTLEIDGEVFRFREAFDGNTAFVVTDHHDLEVTLVDPRDAAAAADSRDSDIVAPMPGAVVSVEKAPGDGVNRGETVITIESMKLQTALVSPRDGVVESIHRDVGQTFDKGDVIARLAEPATAHGES